MALVRYFAAAAELAQTQQEHVQACTLGQLRSALRARHSTGFASVLDQCSLLVDGSATTDPDTRLGEQSTIDILPPFAGG